MKPPIALLLIFLCGKLHAQETEEKIKPICTIHVTTMNENKMKGLLILTKDSVVAVYPGNHKQWNKGKKYNAVVFGFSRIKKVTIKKNNRVLKGISVGAVIGMLPALSKGFKDDKSGITQLTELTVPVGIVTGAIVGVSAQRTFMINGTGSLFYKFQKQVL
jgi:hypothetical protein